MTIRPIRNDRDHALAVNRVDELMGAAPGTPEFDELDVLATLIDAYERTHHPVDPPTPVEAIRFRMEQGEVSRADLAELLGSRAKVTEVLERRRALSKLMIVRLHRRLAIPYDVLLGDVDPTRTKRTPVGAKRRKSARRRSTH